MIPKLLKCFKSELSMVPNRKENSIFQILHSNELGVYEKLENEADLIPP